MKDIAPNYLPVLILIGHHVCYQLSGNAFLAMWIIYASTPLYNFFVLDDNRNVARKNEKVWMTYRL